MREDGAVIGVVGLDGAHVDALGPEGSGPPVNCVQIYRYEKYRYSGTGVAAGGKSGSKARTWASCPPSRWLSKTPGRPRNEDFEVQT